MGEETNQSTEKSEFNMGLAQLERINNILTHAINCASIRDFEMWYENLLSLDREMSYLFSHDEQTISNTYQEVINNLMPSYLLFIKNRNIKRKHPLYVDFSETELYDDYGIVYDKIRDYEKFLRQVLNSRNMLGKKTKDTSQVVVN